MTTIKTDYSVKGVRVSRTVIALLDSHGCKYYIKEDLFAQGGTTPLTLMPKSFLNFDGGCCYVF